MSTINLFLFFCLHYQYKERYYKIIKAEISEEGYPPLSLSSYTDLLLLKRAYLLQY